MDPRDLGKMKTRKGNKDSTRGLGVPLRPSHILDAQKTRGKKSHFYDFLTTMVVIHSYFSNLLKFQICCDFMFFAPPQQD